jgi:hypothetical protein
MIKKFINKISQEVSQITSRFSSKRYLIWNGEDYYRDIYNEIVIFDTLRDADFIMSCKFPNDRFPNAKIHLL